MSEPVKSLLGGVFAVLVVAGVVGLAVFQHVAYPNECAAKGGEPIVTRAGGVCLKDGQIIERWGF